MPGRQHQPRVWRAIAVQTASTSDSAKPRVVRSDLAASALSSFEPLHDPATRRYQSNVVK